MGTYIFAAYNEDGTKIGESLAIEASSSEEAWEKRREETGVGLYWVLEEKLFDPAEAELYKVDYEKHT